MKLPTVAASQPDASFAKPASADQLDRAAAALRERGFEATVVPGDDAAREALLDMVPAGAQVGEGASVTLDTIGVTAAIEGGSYDAIRPRLRAMDRATQADEIRRLGSSPDWFLGSAQAVTLDGQVLLASATGSQIGPIASGAGHVVLVVGAQKVVPDLDTAFARLTDYSFPLEDARIKAVYGGGGSAIRRVLVMNGEMVKGRTHVLLVAKAVGV